MKTKHHEINLPDLQEWMKDAELVYASSSRERKRLVLTAYGGFKVVVAGQTVHECLQPIDAVKAYNAITEKYVEPKKEPFVL